MVREGPIYPSNFNGCFELERFLKLEIRYKINANIIVIVTFYSYLINVNIVTGRVHTPVLGC